MYNSKFHCPRQTACLQTGSLFYTLIKIFKPIITELLKSFLHGDRKSTCSMTLFIKCHALCQKIGENKQIKKKAFSVLHRCTNQINMIKYIL